MSIKKDRLEFILDYFNKVFEEGGKIPLNSDTQFIFSLFEELHSKRMLIEKPNEYFQSDVYTGIGDTSNISLPYQATEQRRYYDKELHKQNALNVRTIGTKVSTLNNKNLSRLEDVSAGYVFPTIPSLQGIYEFLWLLNNKINSKNKDKPIYVDTSNNPIFELLSKELGLTPKNLEKEGIFSAKGRVDIANQITKKIKTKKFNDELEFSIKPGAILYFATTSDKKLLEFQKFFSEYGVKVRSLTDLVGIFKDADELHGSLETNAIGLANDNNSGKLYTAIRKVKSMSQDEIKKKITDQGGDPKNSYIVSDDRGSALSNSVMEKLLNKFGSNLPRDIKTLLFSKYDHKAMIKNKTLPGAEIKHFIDAADGIGNFWKILAKITSKLPKTHNYIENAIAIALTPVSDCYTEQQRIFSTSAKIKFKVIPDAKPNLPYIESEQHTASFKDEENTLAQIIESGDWEKYFKLTDIGRALKSVADNFNLEKGKKNNHSLFEGYEVGLISNTEYDIDGFNVNTLKNTGKILDNKDANHFLSQNDCFVFDGNINDKDISKTAHAFFKIIVAKQTDDRDLNKFIIVNKPNVTFQKLIDLYYDLYATGYIKEYPPRMFSVAHNDEQLIKAVETHVNEYTKKEVIYDTTKKLEKSPHDAKNSVFIACSASSDNQENYLMAAITAFHLALSGKNIVYGSGDKKMMGGIYHGYMLAKKFAESKRLGFNSEIIASSTPDLLKRETELGKKPKGIKEENFHLAETIEYRKHFLYNSSGSAIILPGGAGTLEEFFYCSAQSKFDNRNYNINVLNHKKGYDLLTDIAGDNTTISTELDRLLHNVYHIDIKNSKEADQFLLDELETPKQTVLKLHTQGVDIIDEVKINK